MDRELSTTTDEQATWNGPLAVGTETLGTQVAVPAPVAARQAAVASGGVDDAMRAREVAALRGFVWLVLALSAAVLAALPLLNLITWILRRIVVSPLCA
ncbi:MAG: hypothetical protein KC464_20430, partial [Myxococcales bacterium]|nr:hypothetical protein [Myxococcales bacterium]